MNNFRNIFKTLLIVITAGVINTGTGFCGDMNPPATPDSSGSAMYTLEDVYNLLDTGVANTKRTGGFTQPAAAPGSTGYTLDDIHAKAAEKAVTCEGTLNGTRWCDQEDGTVKDMTTGLVWLKDASWGGTKPWRVNTACTNPEVTCYDDAHNRAGLLSASDASAGLSDGSVVGDWRLPTKEEIYVLAHGIEAVRYSTMRAFTGVYAFIYWSSTAVESNIANAWTLLSIDGSVTPGGSKTGKNYVWPVRCDN